MKLPPASPSLIVVTLSLLLGLQSVTTDLYLPALPTITEGLGASMGQAQLTLTALLLAFGCSQLVWGPLSDRFGRRPILLWGLGAYVLASAGCALASSIDFFIVWRMVQGAALGAGVMGARAITRDLFTPVEGAHVMTKALTGLGLLTIITGPLGGLLTAAFGWRVAMFSLCVFGLLTLALVAWRFTESNPYKNAQALNPATLLRTWLGIARHPTFRAFSALSTATYAGLFTFLASSSFVFIQVLGLTNTHYGFVMGSMPLAYIGGTFLCRRLLPSLGVLRTVAIGAGFTLAGGGLMAGLAWTGVSSGWAIMPPFYLYMIGHGIHHPCAQSGAVGPFPKAAGAASALNGFLMMLMAFAMGGWLGSHMDGTVRPLAFGVCFWSVITALVAWTWVQKHGNNGAI
jgi:DHA1 family bicyclomycin/chloramphenicol resistance-like MFS transporter